jgi:hypothetical protein
MLSLVPEVIEPHSWTLPAIGIVNLSCTDSNPCQLASYAVPFGLWSHPSNADHGVEFPTTDGPHAVIATKLTRFRIRIPVVRPFIDKRSHRCLIPHWWRRDYDFPTRDRIPKQEAKRIYFRKEK